jgi:hypothetical protein
MDPNTYASTCMSPAVAKIGNSALPFAGRTRRIFASLICAGRPVERVQIDQFGVPSAAEVAAASE